MTTEKEAIDDEKCNFKEILQRWKAFNHEQSGHNGQRDPRRCVSAGQSTNIPMTCQSVPFKKDPPVHHHKKQINQAFTRKKWPKLLANSRVTSQPQEFVGRAIVRTEFGESKIAETYYTVKQHPKSLEIRFEKDKISPYMRYYHDRHGDPFNFDALIYDLARIFTQASVFGDKHGLNKLKKRTRYPENSADKSLRPSTHNTIWIPEIHQCTHDPYMFRPESLFNVLSLLEQQGSNVVMSKHVRFAPASTKDEQSPPSKSAKASLSESGPTIENGRYLQRLAAIYASAGAYPEFCFAYLTGVFAVVEMGKPTPESSFFADCLRNVSLPQPVGNLEWMLDSDEHNIYSNAQFTFDPLNDALKAAAFASVSDPGSPYVREWQPVISCAKSPEQHLVNIMENAKDFFTCWLENCSISLLPRQYSQFASVRIDSALISNYMNALRFIDEPYLEQSTVVPWFALEPTHILQPQEIKYTYGGCTPLGPANLEVVKVLYFEDLQKVKRLDGVLELTLAWHSLRKNLFLWLLSNSVCINGEELIDIRDENWKTSLPSPLRIFNTSSQEPSVIGIQNDRTGGALDKLSISIDSAHEKLELIIWPLEVSERSRSRRPEYNSSVRVSESAKLISNREPPNCSDTSLIRYDVQGISFLRTSGKSGSAKKTSTGSEKETGEPHRSESYLERTREETFKVETVEEEPKQTPDMDSPRDGSERRSESPANIRSDLESGSEVEVEPSSNDF